MAVAARRPSNRKSRPSLPDNGVSRIGCEKASPADSLGSEYFGVIFQDGRKFRFIFSPSYYILLVTLLTFRLRLLLNATDSIIPLNGHNYIVTRIAMLNDS